MKKSKEVRREFDFALVSGGVAELSPATADALFEAGCDDATISLRHGLLYAEFSRAGRSLKDAILSAIRDLRDADVGADVLRVDECDLVTPAEIARRINRSRQLVSQYINGQRGGGDFPPPECKLDEDSPLWSWCSVARWLADRGLLQAHETSRAETVAAINSSLEAARWHKRQPRLFKDIAAGLASC